MLMAMAPENNSDLSLGGSSPPETPAPTVLPNTDPENIDPVTPSNLVAPNTDPTIPVAPVTPPVAPVDPITPVVPPAPPVTPSSPIKEKKSHLKVITTIMSLIILLGGVAALAYHEGQSKRLVVPAATVLKPIDLPPEAIVTAACVPGRGKQYIIPKDIPEGPIYDVEKGKVIAIEYVLGIQQLLSNSSAFSSTLLLLTKNYPVDHFTVVPVPPEPGATDEYVHLIMFVVSANEANSITCAGTPSASSTPTPTATSSPTAQ